jgi:hypothetical protein
MPGSRSAINRNVSWTPTPDTSERFSTGIPDFDRLLGGGYPRGAMTLFEVDHSVGPSEWTRLLAPALLNFLYQSRGVIAVLPSRQSPHEFRDDLTKWVSRRRFDTRVRVVVYTGEDDDLPYVVSLRDPPESKKVSKAKLRSRHMQKMVVAEVAAKGVRTKPIVELMSFEIPDMMFGSSVASRMFLLGTKRVRIVGNLMLGILRPGVGCADVVRGMADATVALGTNEHGVTVRGIRPAFPTHLAVVDPRRGPPHVSFVPVG